MHLIPYPTSLVPSEGSCFIGNLASVILPTLYPRSLFIVASDFVHEVENLTSILPRIVCGKSPDQNWDMKISITNTVPGAQHYRLQISANGIEIQSGGEAGAFYAVQTLRQLLRAHGPVLPFLTIDDQPDFPHRGFYHDVTRSKVPTLNTLKKLVDKLAYYKINQLQLYVEHTFAFAKHSDIWSGTDPLTAAEILELDQYCRDRQIELVPSMSTFGHFYMALRSKRNEELNELEIKGGERPFSYNDRMAHYTLDCQNPRSLTLVREMLGEYLPLFSSQYFNICCDETFDLGKGRNRLVAEQVGTGRLYIEFLKKVMNIISDAGKKTMFWGDVILKYPEFIHELPSGTIALDWDYRAEVKTDTAKFKQANMEFYICPGVGGWNKFTPDINNASQNIVNFSQKGLKLGASGLLNTDWGDFGHINCLGTSFHGLALGAAASWNSAAAQDLAQFDQDWEVLELGLPKTGFVKLWREFSATSVVDWDAVERRFDSGVTPDNPNFAYDRRRYENKLDGAITKLKKLLPQISVALAKANPLDPLIRQEFMVGFRGTLLMHETLQCLVEARRRSYWQIADDLRRFEATLSALWLKRNKLGEYDYFRAKIREITSKLDELGGIKA